MGNVSFNLNLLEIGKSPHKLIIKGVNFSLSENEQFAALVGESGLGKTTIYKSLFNAYVNQWKKEGDIKFECNHTFFGEGYSSEDIKKGKKKLNFGFATQVPYFYSYKTVEENLFFPLKWMKLSENTKKFKDEYLAKFNLTPMNNKQMHLLSGGQRQIVNLARVFLSKPDLVIIDESLSNMNEEMAKFYQQLIITHFPSTIIFLTSHRPSDIKNFNAKEIRLIKKIDESNHEYVTMEKNEKA